LYSAVDRDVSVPGQLGLVRRDLPVAAWELIPLSFMIDRVINVKRFLKTASALSSSEVQISRGSFETVRYLDVRLARLKNLRATLNPHLNSYTPSTTPWVRYEDFSLTRSTWWPDIGDVASTLFRGSGLVDGLTKCADSAALIVAHLSRR
jgi:hypothetical protein